jgi:hypothetical protein
MAYTISPENPVETCRAEAETLRSLVVAIPDSETKRKLLQYALEWDDVALKLEALSRRRESPPERSVRDRTMPLRRHG